MGSKVKITKRSPAEGRRFFVEDHLVLILRFFQKETVVVDDQLHLCAYSCANVRFAFYLVMLLMLLLLLLQIDCHHSEDVPSFIVSVAVVSCNVTHRPYTV